MLSQSKCILNSVLSEGLTSCLLINFLVAILVILIMIIYLLSAGHEDKENKHYVGSVSFCSVSIVVIVGLMINTIRDTCFSSSVKKWKIYNQEFSDEDLNRSSHYADNSGPVIMILPASVRVRGRKVKTPVLSPPMQAVMRGDLPVAFAPCATAYRSLQTAMQSDPFKFKNNHFIPSMSLK